MRWPLKNVYITQPWGANPDIYKRFGLLGHNGLDLRAPMGTEVFAPHDGVIKEKRLDADGYGNYIKIESDKEGSVLGHLKDFNVNINQQVKEGDLVGWADNTGFSTGSHLHWGYYKIPRNRDDGYLGYINQEPLLKENMADTVAVPTKDFENLVKKSTYWDGVASDLSVGDLEGYRSVVGGFKSRITTLTNDLGTAQAEVKNREEQVSRLKDEVIALEIKLKERTDQVNQFAREKGELAVQVEQLKVQVETLKQQQTQGEVTLTIKELFYLIWNQKITIKK
jgi:septal ring factor EnvC (AmiA/AmiB activator)